MLEAIAKPFGLLLLWLYGLVGNYGVAIFLFALIVKLILLPFQMKSKKSMMRMNSLTPQVKALEKRHEGNPRKYQEEVSKLYKEEHVNPMSGCLWSLIPFPILLALYKAIRQPPTVMMGVSKDLIAEGGAIFQKLTEMGFDAASNNAYIELNMSEFISAHFGDFSGLSDKLVQINYKFLGLNLGSQPQWNFFSKVNWSDVSDWLPALGLFLIPIISGLMSWLAQTISQKSNPTGGTAASQQAAQQMKTMNIMMPLVSVYICFIMPAALGIYWIFNSVLMIVQDLILNAYYGKRMEAENAAREENFRLREAEYERKRQETERLRAEGATVRNENTSKKKLQAKQRAELDGIKAAAIREERARRREMLGISDEEDIPASQVGNRRYARGRAYVEDRFTNPEGAEAATAAAAAASERDEQLAEKLAQTPEETAVTESAEMADKPADEQSLESDEMADESEDEPDDEPEDDADDEEQ